MARYNVRLRNGLAEVYDTRDRRIVHAYHHHWQDSAHRDAETLNKHDALVWNRTAYSTYRKARDIVRHAEYLERHGYRNHPVIAAVKASAAVRMA